MAVIFGRQHWRWCLLAALSSGAGAACSVDTSGVTFIDDGDFATFISGSGSVDPNTSGASSGKNGGSGGSASVSHGGSTTSAGKAGATSATAGSAGSGKAGSGSGGMLTGGAGGAGMQVGAGAPAVGGAVMCPLVSSNPMDALVDDFEDGDAGLPMRGGRVGGWYIATDGTGVLEVPATDPNMPPALSRPGYDGRGYAFRAEGGYFTDWGAVMGVSLLAPPGRPLCPYDVTPQRAVTFYLKAAVSDDELRVNLPTTETLDKALGGTCQTSEKCDDHFGITLTGLPVVWTQVTVPFDKLTQAGWGTAKRLDLRHVLDIEFSLKASTTFDVWIDQVEFR